jgi:hypothetical protein
MGRDVMPHKPSPARLLGLGAALATALAIAGPAHAQSVGGCQLQGTAAFAPALTNTAQDFTYSFGGDLTGCQSTEAGAPATGTVEAGRVVTDATTGERFQEPISTGNGSCATGTGAGTVIATWADGTRTVISYTTTALGVAVNLAGTVVDSVTLPAIDPQPGQPTSLTIETTRYTGDTVQGLLAFQADPTLCSGAGVTNADISGFTGLGGSA